MGRTGSDVGVAVGAMVGGADGDAVPLNGVAIGCGENCASTGPEVSFDVGTARGGCMRIGGAVTFGVGGEGVGRGVGVGLSLGFGVGESRTMICGDGVGCTVNFGNSPELAPPSSMCTIAENAMKLAENSTSEYRSRREKSGGMSFVPMIRVRRVHARDG